MNNLPYLKQRFIRPHATYVAYMKQHASFMLVLLTAGITGCLLWLYAITYLWPAQYHYSYAGNNCIAKNTLLPDLHKLHTGNSITAKFDKTKRIGNYPLISRAVCFNFASLPPENAVVPVELEPLGNPMIKQTTKITVSSFPRLNSSTTHAVDLLSTRDKLLFSLDKADSTFSYQLSADNKTAACEKQGTTVACDVPSLNLIQAKTYQISLKRSFNGKLVDTLVTKSVQTVTPLTAIDSSIKQNAVVYDSPTKLSITFDKALASSNGAVLKDQSGKSLSFTTQYVSNQLVLTISEPLARSTNFELTIPEATATDKGFLTQPYKLTFTTSGGPKVTGKNIGGYDVAANVSIRLNFDVAIKPETAAKFIQLNGNHGQIATKITVSGNTITIVPARNFETCETFSVKVLDGIENVYGITGGSAYQHNSRSTCRVAFSIGTSVEGRSLVAYRFGNGPSTVLYVGNTHGDEASSKYLLDSWVTYLESVAPTIPSSRSIIVIPSINPDGFAHKSRLNAHGVDLNRNFPANSWKANVTIPGGQLVTNGGGASPLSEPESAALANYTQSLKPRLVLTYHSKASLVTANESGDSMALATLYGKKTGYKAVAESQLGNTFNYDTTGAYENWLHDKLDLPALLIELPGHTANYFNSNRDALWNMVSI